MSGIWKEALLAGGDDSPRLPEGYAGKEGVVGREELLAATDRQLWSASEFVARARTPHTTSAVEAEIRRRHLKRLIRTFDLDLARPLLDLGCADGTFAHDLLELGAEQLVSTDILPHGVATLDSELDAGVRDRILLVVDDLLRLPFEQSVFGTVIAWGILSVTGDFDRALGRAWGWVAPGGYLLLAEPLLEQALIYALVRGDLSEFRRIKAEHTRPAMWDKRQDRYRVNPRAYYETRLDELPGATVAEAGGINVLPSLVLGGLLQDAPVADSERATLADDLSDESLDDLSVWRQAFWLVRKR